MSPGAPVSVIILLCLLASAGSSNAQALTPSQIRAKIQEVSDQRFELREEFATLVQQYRDASPQERQRALESWQKANAAKLQSLGEQQRDLQASITTQGSRAIPPLREAPASLSPKEKEQWNLRQTLNQSKMAELARVKDLSPQARREAMTAWQRQNAWQITKLNEASKALDAEREIEQSAQLVGPREIIIPAMPSYLPDSRQSDWDQMWILRHEKITLLEQHRDSAPVVRQSAMESWTKTRGSKLSTLETQLSPTRN